MSADTKYFPEPEFLRPLGDAIAYEEYKAMLRDLVDQHRGLLYLVPSNGNYAGNGANDAWLKWEAYGRVYEGLSGDIPRSLTGELQIQEWLRGYSEQYPNSDPLNLKPLGRGDWAAFVHDIKSWGGILSDVRNNLVFSYETVMSFLETRDPYDVLAAPFISLFGSAANVVTEAVNAGLDIYGGLTSGFNSVFQGTHEAIQRVWEGDFFGAVNSFFSGIATGINNLINGIGDAFRHLFPLILDLDGDGIELLTNEQASGVRLYEADGETYVEGGWVAADDGVLGIDLNGNGLIDSLDEFVFTRMNPQAHTDLEALRVLDDNSDGVLDGSDAAFARLMVWRDRDTDGRSDPGEAVTLTDAGIVSISLSLNNMVDQTINGHDILHLTQYRRSDGTSGLAADVVFILPTHPASGPQSAVSVYEKADAVSADESVLVVPSPPDESLFG